MITNKKGTILPITVIAMVIMMIIGLISLKMFQVRNTLMTEDILKLRLFYSAEGCVEIMRAGIDKLFGENKDSSGYSSNKSGYLAGIFPVNTKKYILEGEKFSVFSSNKCFEELYENGYKSSPRILCRVYCECLGNAGSLWGSSGERVVPHYRKNGITFPDLTNALNPDFDEYYYYRIVAESSATYKSFLGTKLMVSTVTYYFYTKLITERDTSGNEKYKHEIYFAGWRRN